MATTNGSIAPIGIGLLVTRQGFLARSSGEQTLDLWSADWKIAAGHRIAVRATDANRAIRAPSSRAI